MSEQPLRWQELPPAAHALARWTVLLMGWVWLGQQGQRLGWSVASGVLAVALWWALRLVFGRCVRQPARPRSTAVLLGVVTVAGVLLLAQSATGTPARALLLALAAVWALWSASLEASGPAARCQRPWAGWPPLVAALLTWTVLGTSAAPLPHGWAAGALLLGSALLGGLATPQRPPHTTAWHTDTASSALPQTAMGLMMGSLWLGTAWCTAAGWPLHTVVGLHLALMAAMPGLTRLDWIPLTLTPLAKQVLPLALLALGALVLLTGEGTAHGVTGMVLMALAWALQGDRQAAGHPRASACALGGPALLLAVGLWSPALGPQALLLAYGLLGLFSLVALVALLAQAWRTPHTPPKVTPNRPETVRAVAPNP